LSAKPRGSRTASGAPLEPATVEKRAKTGVRLPRSLSIRMRVQRETSGFVTVKCPYAPEPTACTMRSGIRSRLKRASFSSRC
jgi:hypothetical protein